MKVNNPSSWPLRIVIALVALLATCIALYLSLYQWRVVGAAWDPVFGNGTRNVLDSALSHEFTSWIRIPDASLGVFAYFSDILFSLAGSDKRWEDRPWLVILFGIFAIPVGCVSITLVVLQGLVVKSWCFLCLMTASLSLIIIILAYDEVSACIRFLLEVKQRGGSVWWTFWGYPSREALEAGEAVLQRRAR